MNAEATIQKPRQEVISPGVWCCERRSECRWGCFVLTHGLAWGTVLPESHAWRKFHDRNCGGRLIQLLPPDTTVQIVEE